MDRRVYLDDKHAELKQQTYNLFPERWGDIYRDDELPPSGATAAGDIGTAFGSEPELPVTNLDDYDKFYASLSQTRGITGEQAMRYSDDPLGKVLGVPEGERFWSVND
jgi:hypothetical protein